MMPLLDLAGHHYGRLTVLSRDGSDEQGHACWLCRCDCGRTTRVRSIHLRRAKNPVQSCGCLIAEVNPRRGPKVCEECGAVYQGQSQQRWCCRACAREGKNRAQRTAYHEQHPGAADRV